MDAVDPALLDAAETALAGTAGVECVTRVRMRPIRHRLHADADPEVDQACSALAAHEIAHRAEEPLWLSYPGSPPLPCTPTPAR